MSYILEYQGWVPLTRPQLYLITLYRSVDKNICISSSFMPWAFGLMMMWHFIQSFLRVCFSIQIIQTIERIHFSLAVISRFAIFSF